MSEQTDNIVLEINTIGGDHKAVILKTEDNKFSTIIYEWNETDTDKDGLPVWEKVAGPFVLDEKESAQKTAQENLEIFSLEVPDTSIDEALIVFVEEVLGHKDFKFLQPSNFEVEFLESPEKESFTDIKPEKVLCCENFCFVESDGKWISGILEKKGEIKGWKKFNDLKSALASL